MIFRLKYPVRGFATRDFATLDDTLRAVKKFSDVDQRLRRRTVRRRHCFLLESSAPGLVVGSIQEIGSVTASDTV